MTLRQNHFARFFMFGKKWVNIALKYCAKLFFLGCFWGFVKGHFTGQPLRKTEDDATNHDVVMILCLVHYDA